MKLIFCTPIEVVKSGFFTEDDLFDYFDKNNILPVQFLKENPDFYLLRLISKLEDLGSNEGHRLFVIKQFPKDTKIVDLGDLNEDGSFEKSELNRETLLSLMDADVRNAFQFKESKYDMYMDMFSTFTEDTKAQVALEILKLHMQK